MGKGQNWAAHCPPSDAPIGGALCKVGKWGGSWASMAYLGCQGMVLGHVKEGKAKSLIEGFGRAFDPIPLRSPTFYQSDAVAIHSDWSHLAEDMLKVVSVRLAEIQRQEDFARGNAPSLKPDRERIATE